MLEGNVRIAATIDDSIVDGVGLRFTIFTQGCRHHCKGCHNPKTWDFKGGYLVSVQDLYDEIMDNPLLDGVTFSGGDPFFQPKPLALLAKALHEAGKNVWAYTGFTLEKLQEISLSDRNLKELLDSVDVLVDGPFILEKRDISLRFRGSSNQRVIDMIRTREEGKPVLYLV